MQDQTMTMNYPILEKLEKQVIECRYKNKINYYKIGTGKTIILVNAYGIAHGAWREVIKYLSNDYKIITWDSRGLEEIIDPVTDEKVIFNVTEHAKDLREIFNAEGLDKVDIVAWCTGSKPTIQFYMDNPSKINSISFIAGNFAPIKDYEDLSTKWGSDVRSLCQTIKKQPRMATLIMKTLEKVYFDSTFDFVNDPDTDARLKTMILSGNPSYRDLMMAPFMSKESIINYANMIAGYIDHDINNLLPKISVPTFLIGAGKDLLVHPKLASVVAQIIKGSKLKEFPDVSHWCVLENGKQVADEIDAFLKSVH